MTNPNKETTFLFELEIVPPLTVFTKEKTSTVFVQANPPVP
jgi:hypothetical protein